MNGNKEKEKVYPFIHMVYREPRMIRVLEKVLPVRYTCIFNTVIRTGVFLCQIKDISCSHTKCFNSFVHFKQLVVYT